VELVRDGAPEGDWYAQYSNERPGWLAHSNQGFPLDGRRVAALRIRFYMKTEAVRPGPEPNQLPCAAIAMFDRQRELVKLARLGQLTGTHGWTQVEELLSVPPSVRDAVIMIGLHGATGRAAFDDIQLEPVPRAAPRR